jgi:hypothetical protein
MAVIPPHECGTCKSRWGGYGTCHCSGCHLTTTSISAHDKHRKNYQCLTPEDAGLVLSDREYECWKLPGTGDYWENN